MKITIQKTMYLEELPEEIDESFSTVGDRFAGAKQILNLASQNASEGRYVDASEDLERLREVLSLIDKNLEEQQSLMLSYEKIRIASQFPEQETDDVQ
jgi:conjugal transfer/entry exclusion protein